MNMECLARVVYRRFQARGGVRALLVGMSGIDASGKGYLSAQLEGAIAALGLRVARIGVDDWLDLPTVRFAGPRPAEAFYHRGLRIDAMFEQVVLPLRERRSIDVSTEHLHETAAQFHRARVRHERVDVVLVEGIFLFKRRYQRLFDLALWVDCSFETALERALARSQEGLSPDATRSVYEQVYFPAQRLHLDEDDPISATDYTIRNDPRLPADLKRMFDCRGIAA